MTESAQQRCVLLVLGSADGGVGAHVRALVDQLSILGWQVSVAGPQATDNLFGFAAAGARFHPVEIRSAVPSPAQLSRARELRRAASGAALVHAHGLRAGAVAVLAFGPLARLRRRNRPTPLAVTWHNLVLEPPTGPEASSSPGLARALRNLARRAAAASGEQLVARGADVTLGASTDLVARAQRRGARHARLFEVATPAAPPLRDPAAVRAELGVEVDAPLVVAVARLHPQKGLDVLVDAAARWRSALPSAAVIIAGEGPLRAQLQDQIDRLDAPVRLLGRREDAADLLAGADVVVLPSRWEARALVAQEALRVGAPLVATTVGGLPDLVGDAAVLIAPDDAAALDTAVASLIRDPARRAQLSRRAIERAAGWPTVQDNAVALNALYRRMLDGAR